MTYGPQLSVCPSLAIVRREPGCQVFFFFCHLKLQESDHQKLLFKNTYHNIIYILRQYFLKFVMYKNHPEQ